MLISINIENIRLEIIDFKHIMKLISKVAVDGLIYGNRWNNQYYKQPRGVETRLQSNLQFFPR